MAVNITITVPEGLHERLQKVKKNFNVSWICQEAIGFEVKRQELLQSGVENDQDVIERLRLEKAELAKKSYDLGYKAGLSIAKYSSYNDFLKLDSLRNHGPWEAMFEFLGSEDWLYIDTDFDEYEEEFPGLDSDLFAKGCFAAVVDFYDKIKDQL